MTPELESVLSECDNLGITLAASRDKITFRTGDIGLPDDLRARLVAVRPALTAVLGAHGRPGPDPVLFVSRALDVHPLPAFVVRVSVAVYVGTRPYYRLTPRVWHWLCVAVDRRAEANVGNVAAVAECQAAAALLADLGQWIDTHYRPDQIRRACRAVPSLPDVPPLPKWVVVADAQDSSRAKQTQAVPNAARPAPTIIPATITLTPGIRS